MTELASGSASKGGGVVPSAFVGVVLETHQGNEALMETELTTIPIDQRAQAILHVALIWIGVATIAGVSAKLLVPGERPRGTFSTLALGMIASTVANLLLHWIMRGVGIEDFNPVSLLGITTSIVLACGLLALLRSLTWKKPSS
ncbi:MAG: GlsB/YeaQ/YmgE family stress response membrane protein [Planctomycetia bacterium]|nr:GlsB/YeaQ/YmgE family stress response membrane protein [Planctomycetia bacterium]